MRVLSCRSAKEFVGVVEHISKKCVGVDAHIDPAESSDYTEIQCEFVGSQWGDVGIAPYANLEIKQKTLPVRGAFRVLFRRWR